MQPIVSNETDRMMLNYLIRNGLATRQAIENAADKISRRGQKPYPSNVCKFFGYSAKEVLAKIEEFAVEDFEQKKTLIQPGPDQTMSIENMASSLVGLPPKMRARVISKIQSRRVVNEN